MDRGKQRQGVQLDRYLIVKLNFHNSDILRFSNVEMRRVQFLEGLSQAFVGCRWKRCAINPFEYAAGLHKWFLQVVMHCGYYTFFSSSEAAAGVDGKDKQLSGLAAEFLKAKPVARSTAGMSTEDALSHELLLSCKLTGVWSTADARNAVKDKFRNVRKLADMVKKVLAKLSDIGLVFEATVRAVKEELADDVESDDDTPLAGAAAAAAPEDASESDERDLGRRKKAKPNARSKLYRKATQHELDGDAGAQAERQRLKVDKDCFE